MTEKVAVSFSELKGADAAAAGGKAASLARMLQAGYPVPDGFVLLPNAFDGDDLAPGSWAAAENQLHRLRRNGGTSFAVRSSALSEDSARASFAGEFTSRLGVTGDEPLRETIRAVRVSRRSERVRQYSHAQGNLSAVQRAARLSHNDPGAV